MTHHHDGEDMDCRGCQRIRGLILLSNAADAMEAAVIALREGLRLTSGLLAKQTRGPYKISDEDRLQRRQRMLKARGARKAKVS